MLLPQEIDPSDLDMLGQRLESTFESYSTCCDDRAIWREDFGEEMPPDVAEGPWIDMEALGDKAMREEFVSDLSFHFS